MFSIEDDVPDENKPSITDTQSVLIPGDDVVAKRAARTNFALGDQSPGPDRITHAISTGDEYNMRVAIAQDEDTKDEQLKQDMVARYALSRGGNISNDDIKLIDSLTNAQLKNDPATIIEKKFSDRYINYVLAQQDQVKEDAFRAAHQATDLTTDLQVLHKFREDLDAKWAQTGVVDTTTSFIGQVVPFLPWWRQADALQKRPNHGRLLPGGTMEENVKYWWALPPDQRMSELQATMKAYEAKGQTLDAMTFVNSLIAFPASDQFLANSMGIADYTTGSSLWGKLAGKIFGRAATKAVPSAEQALEKAAPHLVAPKEPTPAPTQLDLFGDQPSQGSFRFMTQPGMAGPPEAADWVNPAGAIRRPDTGKFVKATTRDSLHANSVSIPHNTGEVPVGPHGEFRGQGGRFGKSTEVLRQQELDLGGTGPHQPDLFGGGSGPAGPGGGGFGLGTEAQKYAAAGRHAPSPITAAEEEASRFTRHALADAVKAVSDPDATPVQVMSQLGDLASAGILGALGRMKGRIHDRGLAGLAMEIPTFSNPWGFYQSSKALGRENAQRVTQYMLTQGGELIDKLKNTTRPSRMTDTALKVAQDNARVGMMKEYAPNLQNGALDFEYLPAGANMWGVDAMIGWVGKNDATLPKTMAEAKLWAKDIYKLGDHEYILEQQGNGVKIGVFRHLDETKDNVREGLIKDPENRSTGGIVKMALNRLMSADNILPRFQGANRSIATHAPQEVRRALKDMVDADIHKTLSKAEKKGLEKVLIENRDGPNPNLPGERGFWHDTAAEFEIAYQRANGEYPSSNAVKAYDTFRRVNDFDWLLRNLDVYRDKARQGAEQFRFVHHTSGSAEKTDFFEGVARDSLPWSSAGKNQDAGVFMYNPATKKGEFKYMQDFTPAEKKAIDNSIANEGHRVVQILDPKTHPLAGIVFGKTGQEISERINFVVTNTWDKAPLSWKQVEYRAGGHSIYPGNFYVSQPVVKQGRKGKDTYFGDNNILNVGTEAEARKWSERLDNLRVMLKTGRTAEAEAYRAANLPYSKEQIDHLFHDHGAPLSLHHPVAYKEAGRNTWDTVGLKAEYHDVVDSTKDIYDLTNFMDKAFLADRDNIIQTVRENGMLNRLVDAEQLDPYTAMNRAMGQAMRNTWMNDYKISAAESFLKDFEDVLKPRREQLEASPMYWIYHPQYRQGADAARVSLANAAQRSIVTFLGQNTDLGAGLDYIGNKLMSTIYNTTGQAGVGVVNAVGKYTDKIGLGSIKDPVQFLRAAAFHMNLGFFNPVQFFVQVQSMSHILGVAGPMHGLPGIAAGVLTRFVAHNPEMVKTIASKAKAFGWKAADFEEMISKMQSSGVMQVAGEAALRDDVFDPRIFRSATSEFLDKGTMFFAEGERLVRLSAFATAFREFKAANKGVMVGDREMMGIMDRFKTLSVQMARDSAASWQHGPLAVPTQFFAFNARLFEQFVGNRLTGAEKIRAMTTYSALYGIPVSAGIVTMGTSPIPGVPSSYEDIKQEAMRRGIDMSPAYLEGLQNGLVSLALHWATGKEYNVPVRYGPGASTALSNLNRQDKTMADIVLGASGTVLKDFFKATQPFFHTAASVFQDNGDYPMVANDWMNVLRNIKTADTAAKMHGIITYGKWITKTGTEVGPADNLDAAMVAVGLTPMPLQDVYLKINAMKDDIEGQKPYAKDAIENWRRGMEAAGRGDTKEAEAFWARARWSTAAGDFNVEGKNKLFHEALSQTQNLQDKIDWDFITKGPASRRDDRLKEYQKGLK